MNRNIDKETLLIIPCCAKKKTVGRLLDNKYCDMFSHVIPGDVYKRIVSRRLHLLNKLRINNKYMSGKYTKNKNIQNGPDFGLDNFQGYYLPAVERYAGNLYSVDHNFSDIIRTNTNVNNKPRMLILSALYGPLHPLSPIQNYNLKMSDSPAYQAWKTCFQEFIEGYVQANQIKFVRLYVGSSTAYFKVARMAIKPLLQKGLLCSAIQYHVIGGNSCQTPMNHGVQILSDLGYRKNLLFTKPVEVNNL